MESTGEEGHKPFLFRFFYLVFVPLLERDIFSQLLTFKYLTNKFDVNIKFSSVLFSQINVTDLKKLLRK